MKWSGWVWVGVISSAVVVSATQAATDNPYRKIVERNVFGLKPIPPPAPPPEAPPPPVPKIILQGITTILGSRQVLFKASSPSLPGRPGKDESYILSEGQREDDIEAIAINEVEGTVKFNNHGVTQLLDMKTDSAKAGAGTALPVATARPPIPVPVFGTQGSAQGGGGEDPNAGLRHIPQRNVRTESEGDNANGNGGDPNQVQANSAPVAAATPEAPPPPEEAQPLLIEANRLDTDDKIRRGEIPPEEIPPPLPPTELTPPGTPGMPPPAPSAP